MAKVEYDQARDKVEMAEEIFEEISKSWCDAQDLQCAALERLVELRIKRKKVQLKAEKDWRHQQHINKDLWQSVICRWRESAPREKKGGSPFCE